MRNVSQYKKLAMPETCILLISHTVHVLMDRVATRVLCSTLLRPSQTFSDPQRRNLWKDFSAPTPCLFSFSFSSRTLVDVLLYSSYRTRFFAKLSVWIFLHPFFSISTTIFSGFRKAKIRRKSLIPNNARLSCQLGESCYLRSLRISRQIVFHSSIC